MSETEFGSGSFGDGPFSNTPFYDTKSLIDAVLKDTGHANPANETSKRVVVLSFLNNRYAQIITKRDWDFLYGIVDINFYPPKSEGTISLESGSHEVTGLGTLFDANDVPGVLIPYNKDETYLIESVESTTALTMQAKWSNDDASGESYQIAKPFLLLPSDCENVRSLLLSGFHEMVQLSRADFIRRKSADVISTGVPKWFTELEYKKTDGTRHVEVFPAPDKRYVARLAYMKRVSQLCDVEATFPIIPDKYRHVLYYGALADMYRYLKDPVHSASADKDFNVSFMGMINDVQIAENTAKVQVGRNYRNRLAGSGKRVFMNRNEFARED